MARIIRLTEQDLARIVRRVIKENEDEDYTSMDDTSMDEHINFDIKTTDCEGSSLGNMSSMGVDEDEDGNIVVFIRYCKGDDEELEYLKRKARLEIKLNYGLDNIEDGNDDQTSEYTSYGKPSKYDPQYSQDPRERYDHGGSQSGH
jgi:hypothetical protein